MITMSAFNDCAIPELQLITLKNRNGLTARFTNYGARWVGMWVPDRSGRFADVVLGFDTLGGYCTAEEQYHGAMVGRVCGRIGNARFSLGTDEYRLAANDVYGKPVPNHLHGGISAFHNRFWKGRAEVNSAGEESAVFTCYSKEGEEGYPGNLTVKVSYMLRHDNRLVMDCEAHTDRLTPVNLTNHAFFNLTGVQSGKNMLSHLLRLDSSRIIACDEELVPTGHFIPVEDTFLDFRTSRPVADALQSGLFQISENRGFSLAFALDKKENGRFPAAELSELNSGRKLTIYTDQPSLQVYTGYFMNGNDRGKGETPYYAGAGIALETQGYPDAVNHPEFPSVLLAPDGIYRHHTEYRFDTFS